MTTATHDDSMRTYHEYLLRRSRLGEFYRQNLLYPALCRELSAHVLDVGCGIGDFLRYRPDTVGIDINPHNVEYCRKAGLDARVAQGRFPFGDRAFNGVVLDNVLEHIPDPTEILREMARVLRPGGTLIVGVPGRKGYASDPDHKRFYDRPLLERTLAPFDFRMRRALHMPLRLPFLDRVLALYCLYGVFTKV